MLNTEGILTLPVFLLSDESLIQNAPPTTAKLNTYVKQTGPQKKVFQTIEIKPPMLSDTTTSPPNIQKQKLNKQ